MLVPKFSRGHGELHRAAGGLKPTTALLVGGKWPLNVTGIGEYAGEIAKGVGRNERPVGLNTDA